MIILTVGIPASGKSSWAKEYIKENQNNTIRICRDDLRLMIGGTQMLDNKGEQLVTKLVEHSIANKGNKNIIIDQTNCNIKYLNKLIDFASSFDTVKLLPFDITLEEAINRDNARVVGRVGPEIITKMAKGFEEVNSSFDFSKLIYKKDYTSEIKNFKIEDNRLGGYLIDLDGTL